MSVWGLGPVTHGTVSVGTASTSLLAANANRQWALLQNDGTVDVYIKLGTAVAALNTGIRLVAGGGAFEMSRGQANVFDGAIQAISSVAATRVMYSEA